MARVSAVPGADAARSGPADREHLTRRELTTCPFCIYRAPPSGRGRPLASAWLFVAAAMKIRHSIKSAKTRERNCLVVRRKRRLYVINKKQPRYKVRQG